MSGLSHIRIRYRLLLLAVAFVLALATTFYVNLHMARQEMVDSRVAKLRTVVELAYGQAERIHARELAGEVTREQAMDQFRTALDNMWYDDRKNYVFSYTMEGISVAMPADPSFVGKDKSEVRDVNGLYIVKGYIDLARKPEGGTLSYYWMRPGETAAVPKLAFVRPFKPWNLFIVTGVYTDDIDAHFQSFSLSAGGVVVLLTVLAGLAAWAVSHSIVAPMTRLRQVMRKMADGDVDLDVPETARRDELGEMARTVEVFKTNASEVRQLRADQEREKERAAIEKKEAMRTLADRFEASVMDVIRSVLNASEGLQTTAQSLSAAVGQSMSQASSVAAASEQATANVQTVAAAAEELSAAIAEISRQVEDSAEISASASATASSASTMVQQLASAADRIGEVVKLINDIAAQTNLLALNATIEAARAGDAGKGFAVVAGEVKHLASQTARATDEISQQIAAVQEETRRTVEAILGIDTVIGKVREISTAIASAVEQQGAATREIARNVQQAAEGTHEVSRNIAGVSESATQTGAAANDVLSSADTLVNHSEKLRNEVSGFLAGIRAA